MKWNVDMSKEKTKNLFFSFLRLSFPSFWRRWEMNCMKRSATKEFIFYRSFSSYYAAYFSSFFLWSPIHIFSLKIFYFSFFLWRVMIRLVRIRSEFLEIKSLGSNRKILFFFLHSKRHVLYSFFFYFNSSSSFFFTFP